MQTWIEQTSEIFAQQDAERQARKAQLEHEKRERFENRHTPMRARLARVIKAMPEDEQVKPRLLDFFTQSLDAKYHRGRHASRSEVAEALRELGWVRQRVWTGSGPFRCWWFPPGVQPPAKTRGAGVRKAQAA